MDTQKCERIQRVFSYKLQYSIVTIGNFMWRKYEKTIQLIFRVTISPLMFPSGTPIQAPVVIEARFQIGMYQTSFCSRAPSNTGKGSGTYRLHIHQFVPRIWGHCTLQYSVNQQTHEASASSRAYRPKRRRGHVT